MKPIRFTPAAEEEMNAAAGYYEGQRHRLGHRFLAAVREFLEKIRIAPDLYPVVDSDVRRCLTKIFPYAVDQMA